MVQDTVVAAVVQIVQYIVFAPPNGGDHTLDSADDGLLVPGCVVLIDGFERESNMINTAPFGVDDD